MTTKTWTKFFQIGPVKFGGFIYLHQYDRGVPDTIGNRRLVLQPSITIDFNRAS